MNWTALKFQAELLLTGSCCAALQPNLKSPCSAWYLWNVLGHSIKSAPQSSFYCPIYLEDRREIGHMATASGKSQVAGAVSSSEIITSHLPSIHSWLFVCNPGQPFCWGLLSSPTALGTHPDLRKNVGDIVGKLSAMMAQPLIDRVRTLSPAHAPENSTRNPCFFVFITSFPFTAALQSSFFALAFLPQGLLSSGSGPLSQIPGRRITVSLHLQGTSGIPCARRQNCVPSVKGAAYWCPWALSPSPVHCSSQESAPWLVQQFCVEGPVPQFSKPLKAFQWVYQCCYEGTHSPHGVGPEVWCRGALSGGTQTWTDWFLRFYKKNDSPCQGEKKCHFLAANAESFHFAAYQQLNFTPFLSEKDLGFLPSVFPASKSRLVCWNKK